MKRSATAVTAKIVLFNNPEKKMHGMTKNLN